MSVSIVFIAWSALTHMNASARTPSSGARRAAPASGARTKMSRAFFRKSNDLASASTNHRPVFATSMSTRYANHAFGGGSCDGSSGALTSDSISKWRTGEGSLTPKGLRGNGVKLLEGALCVSGQRAAADARGRRRARQRVARARQRVAAPAVRDRRRGRDPLGRAVQARAARADARRGARFSVERVRQGRAPSRARRARGRERERARRRGAARAGVRARSRGSRRPSGAPGLLGRADRARAHRVHAEHAPPLRASSAGPRVRRVRAPRQGARGAHSARARR